MSWFYHGHGKWLTQLRLCILGFFLKVEAIAYRLPRSVNLTPQFLRANVFNVTVYEKDVPNMEDLMAMTKHLPKEDQTHTDLACSIYVCTHDAFFPKVSKRNTPVDKWSDKPRFYTVTPYQDDTLMDKWLILFFVLITYSSLSVAPELKIMTTYGRFSKNKTIRWKRRMVNFF